MNVESGWGLNESSFAGSQLLTSTPLGPEYSPPPPPPAKAYKHKVSSGVTFTVSWDRPR